MAVKVGSDDARLADARTPTSHASTHAPGGGDAIATGTTSGTVCIGNDTRLSDKRTADAIYETGGPTTLAIGAIADGKLAKRVGSTFVGYTLPIRELYYGVQTVSSASTVDIGPYTLAAGETPNISVYIENSSGNEVYQEGYSTAVTGCWYYRYSSESAGTFHVRLQTIAAVSRDFRVRITARSTP